jgi:hypothetical protein
MDALMGQDIDLKILSSTSSTLHAELL